MIRQSGFYWVKIHVGQKDWEELTIGEWTSEGNYWEIVRSDELLDDKEVVVVSDRLEEPRG